MRRKQGAFLESDLKISYAVSLFKTDNFIPFSDYYMLLSKPGYVAEKAPETIDLGPVTASKLSEVDRLYWTKNYIPKDYDEYEKDFFIDGSYHYCVTNKNWETESTDFPMVSYKLEDKNKQITGFITFVRSESNLLTAIVNSRLDWTIKSFIFSRLLYCYVLFHPEIFGVSSLYSIKPTELQTLIDSIVSKDYNTSSVSLKQFYDLSIHSQMHTRPSISNNEKLMWPSKFKNNDVVVTEWLESDYRKKFTTLENMISMYEE